MRILPGLLVIILSNITVYAISPTANIGAAVKGETPGKVDLKKKFSIGTSGINDEDSEKNSISAFAAAAKTARIASGLQKAAVEKNLLNSLAQREKKEEEKEEKREKIEKIEKRDNIGHNKSTKIKVVTSKITTKTTTKSKSISKKEESDDESEDEDIGKSVDATGQSSAIKKQILMAGTYMVASRFVMKLDFNNKKIVQLCRVIFACYLLASQLLFYVIKMRIEKEDDSSLVEVQAAFSMKSLTEKIPMLNNLGPIGDILTSAAAPADAPEAPKLTVKEYDLQQLAKLQNELFCEVLSTTFLHFGSKAIKPLIFVPLMGLMNKVRNRGTYSVLGCFRVMLESICVVFTVVFAPSK